MTTASSFVDEMATLLAEVNAWLEALVGKPLCFALVVVHGDDGKGCFWYTSSSSGNLLAEPLTDALRDAANDLKSHSRSTEQPSGPVN